LIAAVVYHAMPLSRRAELHRAAARVVEDEALELHHEAASRDRPDAELAARLEQFARLRMASGSWSVAATALESAARLGVDRRTRERCALDAVDCWLLAGEPAPASSLVADLGAFRPGARRTYVEARLAQIAGNANVAEQLF